MNDYFQAKLARQKTKMPVQAARKQQFKAASHEDQLIADSGHLVHKVKAKDSTGRWAYYFVLVSAAMERVFLRDLKSTNTLDLENYGKVLASNYGEMPSESVIRMLKERYGWDVTPGPGEQK